MFIRRISSALLGCVLVSASFAAHAADRGPSTPEERKQAVEYIHDFESNPLGPHALQERKWVIEWVIEIPDVHISFCSEILDKMNRSDEKDGPTLLAAMIMGQTEFALQHADKAAKRADEFEAGIEAVINVYAALVKLNAKDSQPYLDDLMHRRDAGTLAQLVHDRAAASCKK
jgi:hypothetical protein